MKYLANVDLLQADMHEVSPPLCRWRMKGVSNLNDVSEQEYTIEGSTNCVDSLLCLQECYLCL